MTDMVDDSLLSRAILAYLAKGRSSFPKTDGDAVRVLASGSHPDVLLDRVRAIIAECMSVKVDWSKHSLSEGGRTAQRIVARRHPELSADALEALYWMFTYNWR